MSMLVDALTFLANQTRKSMSPVFLKDPDSRLYMWLCDPVSGNMSQVPIDQPPRSWTMTSISSFCDLANDPTIATSSARIFVSDKEVTLLCDDDDRAQVVNMPLIPDPRFELLRQFAKATSAMDHREFMQVIRRQFGNAFPADVAARLRRVDSAASSRVQSEAGKGRDRGIREFISEVSGAEDLPDTVTISVPVFQVEGYSPQYGIVCSLDVVMEHDKPMFLLFPQPGALLAATSAAQRDLATVLRQAVADVPVLIGTP